VKQLNVTKLISNIKKPAFEKIKLLPTLENFLANQNYQRDYLRNDNQGCNLLEDWLKKNADGTYPPVNQVSKMLDILSNLRLEVDNLQSSKLGKYVMDISKNFISNKGIMRKAKELVEKWTRQIYGINTDYKELANDLVSERNLNRKRDKPTSLEREIVAEEKEKRPVFEEFEDPKNMNVFTHAKIPKKGLLDFNRRPESSISKQAIRAASIKNINYGKIFQQKKEVATKKKYAD